MSSASTLEAELPLSLHLRATTRTAHERAETSGFVESLMRGELTVAAYADLAAQHHVIYTALEAAEPFVRADPAGATMVVDGLRRVPSIERDLTTVLGPGWRDEVRVLPATERYAARLHEVAGTWVGGYVAHAYTRYLGDLSGGLAVKAILQRAYAVPDAAVNFYTFTSIPKPKLFKDDYRARMDALPFDRDERLAVAAEAEVAFGLNTALFAELGAIHVR